MFKPQYIGQAVIQKFFSLIRASKFACWIWKKAKMGSLWALDRHLLLWCATFGLGCGPNGKPPRQLAETCEIIHGQVCTRHCYMLPNCSRERENWWKIPHSIPSWALNISCNSLSMSRKPERCLTCQGLHERKHKVSPKTKGSCSQAGQKLGAFPRGYLYVN
jgi:hypothetical protein